MIQVAADAAKALLPAAFALGSGVLPAAMIVKKLMPHSRLPGSMLVGATMFLLPFFAALSAMVHAHLFYSSSLVQHVYNCCLCCICCLSRPCVILTEFFFALHTALYKNCTDGMMVL